MRVKNLQRGIRDPPEVTPNRVSTIQYGVAGVYVVSTTKIFGLLGERVGIRPTAISSDASRRLTSQKFNGVTICLYFFCVRFVFANSFIQKTTVYGYVSMVEVPEFMGEDEEMPSWLRFLHA